MDIRIDRSGALQRVWAYRWEALPVLVGLAVVHLWPFQPGSGNERLLSDLAIVLLLGVGFLWSVWRDQTMAPGLWAIVFVPRAALFVVAHVLMRFEVLGPLVGVIDAGRWVMFVSNLELRLWLALPVAFAAWGLGFLGKRHALLIAAGYLAWGFVAPAEPWSSLLLDPSAAPSAAGYVLALGSATLWLTMVGALVVAFHHFPSWGAKHQSMAVWLFVGIFLGWFALWASNLLIWKLWLDRGVQGSLQLLLALLCSGLLLFGLTWLLVRRRDSLEADELRVVSD